MSDPSTAMRSLHTIAIDNSDGTQVPVVFLHGFSGVAKQWWGLQTAISSHAPTFAFDLPGHGESLNFEGFGPPKVAAKAVLAELKKHGVERAHFVGHSMGGAVASIIALIAPEAVASLILLAPGGYGDTFNHPLLMGWAAASKGDEIADWLPKFFGPDFVVPPKMIDFQWSIREQEGAVEALTTIANGMSTDGKQGVLPVDDVLAGPYPISMVWGTEDQVLPVEHTEAIADRVSLHILPGVGHSPAVEAPELVQSIILQHIVDARR